MRRAKTYNRELSERLRKPTYAQKFMTALMDGNDGLSGEQALRQTIEIMGIKEFSQLVSIPSSNVVAFVKGHRNLKPQTLERLLKPFGFRVRLIFEKAS